MEQRQRPDLDDENDLVKAVFRVVQPLRYPLPFDPEAVLDLVQLLKDRSEVWTVTGSVPCEEVDALTAIGTMLVDRSSSFDEPYRTFVYELAFRLESCVRGALFGWSDETEFKWPAIVRDHPELLDPPQRDPLA